MDQITAIILASGITGVSTLLAAIVISLIASRQATNVEKLRAKEAERIEQTKRSTEVIQQTYQSLVETDDLVSAFDYDVRNGVRSNLSDIERVKEIKTSSIRTTVIIRLYLRSLIGEETSYVETLLKYGNAIAYFHSGKKGEPIKPQELRAELDEAQKAYKQSLRDLQAKLEEHIKKVL